MQIKPSVFWVPVLWFWILWLACWVACIRPSHYSSGENIVFIYMANLNDPLLLWQYFLPSDYLLQVLFLLLGCQYLGVYFCDLDFWEIQEELWEIRAALGHEWLALAYSDSFMVSVCYRLGFGSRGHPLLVLVSWNKELDPGPMDSGRNRDSLLRKRKTFQRM